MLVQQALPHQIGRNVGFLRPVVPRALLGRHPCAFVADDHVEAAGDAAADAVGVDVPRARQARHLGGRIAVDESELVALQARFTRADLLESVGDIASGGHGGSSCGNEGKRKKEKKNGTAGCIRFCLLPFYFALSGRSCCEPPCRQPWCERAISSAWAADRCRGRRIPSPGCRTLCSG